MTVIKGNKPYFIKPGSSTQASDTESLHLGSASASDTESLHNEPIQHRRGRPFAALPLRPILTEDPVHPKKSSGKKKLRRYQNRCILQTLQEEDESENMIVIIMEPYKSPFTRLLEDSNAMEFWNSFVEKSEEEQSNIINAFSEKYTINKATEELPSSRPLGKISSRTKRTIKTKKNLSIEAVKDSECDMLDFFNSNPNDVYVKLPPTSFDRLILKAIAHYHGLDYRSVNTGELNMKPFIEIFSSKDCWVPADCFLTDFIKQLR